MIKLKWNEIIKKLRKELDMTQAELADKCFTYDDVIWRWETGKHYPREASRILIANALGVNVQAIFGDSVVNKIFEKNIELNIAGATVSVSELQAKNLLCQLNHVLI